MTDSEGCHRNYCVFDRKHWQKGKHGKYRGRGVPCSNVQHRISANDQIGEGSAMLAVAEMVWLESLDNLNDLNTNIIRIHQDRTHQVFEWISTITILISIGSSVRCLETLSGTCGKMQPVWRLISSLDRWYMTILYQYSHNRNIFYRVWPSQANIEHG